MQLHKVLNGPGLANAGSQVGVQAVFLHGLQLGLPKPVFDGTELLHGEGAHHGSGICHSGAGAKGGSFFRIHENQFQRIVVAKVFLREHAHHFQRSNGTGRTIKGTTVDHRIIVGTEHDHRGIRNGALSAAENGAYAVLVNVQMELFHLANQILLCHGIFLGIGRACYALAWSRGVGGQGFQILLNSTCLCLHGVISSSLLCFLGVVLYHPAG